MQVDVQHNVGDKFFHLERGKICRAIISGITYREELSSPVNAMRDRETSVQKKTIYDYIYEDGIGGAIKTGATLYSHLIFATKEDAAKAFLKEAGLSPGLVES